MRSTGGPGGATIRAMKRFVVGLLICVLLFSAVGCKSWNVNVMNMQFKGEESFELSADEKIGVIVVLAAAVALAIFAASQ